jgi:cytochrome b561
VHLVLGVAVLALGVVRPLWRRVAGLPPWSEHLSAGQRRLATWTERALMSLLVLVPLTGLVLVGTGDDAWLPLHVGAHLAFFVVLAAHLSTNLRPAVLRRML